MSDYEQRIKRLEEEVYVEEMVNRGLNQQLWEVQQENLKLTKKVHDLQFGLFATIVAAVTTILIIAL